MEGQQPKGKSYAVPLTGNESPEAVAEIVRKSKGHGIEDFHLEVHAESNIENLTRYATFLSGGLDRRVEAHISTRPPPLDSQVEQFMDAGCQGILFHPAYLGGEGEVYRLLEMIRSRGKKAGIVIGPEITVDRAQIFRVIYEPEPQIMEVEKYLPDVDRVLLALPVRDFTSKTLDKVKDIPEGENPIESMLTILESDEEGTEGIETLLSLSQGSEEFRLPYGHRSAHLVRMRKEKKLDFKIGFEGDMNPILAMWCRKWGTDFVVFNPLMSECEENEGVM
ncbi:hypothetical protein HYS48_04880 [Candidatus Woesearchaeota archaeon]|nr:hypothetical protein [Candidatus Woesearchaeota archaeon]